MQTGQPRHAVYYAPPPDGPLARFGAAWLARPDPALDAARLYGFHGTLKAPIRLRPEHDEAALLAAVEGLAAAETPFLAPPLRPARIGRFIALVPNRSCPELDALAARCVRELDRFRAPPEEAELAKRRRAGLSPRQERMLQDWGYPYVLEEFRFHMTLTGPLDEAQAAVLMAEIGARWRPLADLPTPVDALAVFRQPGPVTAFEPLARFAMAAAGSSNRHARAL